MPEQEGSMICIIFPGEERPLNLPDTPEMRTMLTNLATHGVQNILTPPDALVNLDDMKPALLMTIDAMASQFLADDEVADKLVRRRVKSAIEMFHLAKITYVFDLVILNEAKLLRIRNIGIRKIDAVKEMLARFGLSLRMTIPDEVLAVLRAQDPEYQMPVTVKNHHDHLQWLASKPY